MGRVSTGSTSMARRSRRAPSNSREVRASRSPGPVLPAQWSCRLISQPDILATISLSRMSKAVPLRRPCPRASRPFLRRANRRLPRRVSRRACPRSHRPLFLRTRLRPDPRTYLGVASATRRHSRRRRQRLRKRATLRDRPQPAVWEGTVSPLRPQVAHPSTGQRPAMRAI